MLLFESFENFINAKQADGLSNQSIIDYRWQCKVFLDMFGNYDICGLTNQDIQRFLIHLENACSLSKSSIISYRKSVKIFLKWIESEYDGIQYRYSRIKLKKMPKKETDIYSADDIHRIFDACVSDYEYQPKWIGSRNRLLVALLIDTGIRRCEASGLLRSNIDFESHIMIVSGKGNKQRKVHYGESVAEYMQEYLSKCPYEVNTLFCTKDSRPLSGNAISQILNKIQRKIGIKISPHRCRHNFATNYCLDIRSEGKEVDPNKLQALMGHEDLITTKRYIHDALEITAAYSCPSHLDIITNKKTALKNRLFVSDEGLEPSTT